LFIIIKQAINSSKYKYLEETIRIPFDIGDFKNKALMCISCDPDYTSKKKKNPQPVQKKTLKTQTLKEFIFIDFFGLHFKALK